MRKLFVAILKLLAACSGCQKPRTEAPAKGVLEILEGVLTKYNGASPSVSVPGGVTEIGWWAFSGCPNLTISGEKCSSAEKDAVEEKIPFRVIN